MRRWVVIFNLSLFAVACLAIYLYQWRFYITSEKSCVDKHAVYATTALARDEIGKACHALSQRELDKPARTLALCILNNPSRLATRTESELVRVLEPCYAKVIKK